MIGGNPSPCRGRSSKSSDLTGQWLPAINPANAKCWRRLANDTQMVRTIIDGFSYLYFKRTNMNVARVLLRIFSLIIHRLKIVKNPSKIAWAVGCNGSFCLF